MYCSIQHSRCMSDVPCYLLFNLETKYIQLFYFIFRLSFIIRTYLRTFENVISSSGDFIVSAVSGTFYKNMKNFLFYSPSSFISIHWSLLSNFITLDSSCCILVFLHPCLVLLTESKNNKNLKRYFNIQIFKNM